MSGTRRVGSYCVRPAGSFERGPVADGWKDCPQKTLSTRPLPRPLPPHIFSRTLLRLFMGSNDSEVISVNDSKDTISLLTI